MVFVRAQDLGLSGTERAEALNAAVRQFVVCALT